MEASRRYSNQRQLLDELASTWQRLQRELGEAAPDQTLILRSATKRPDRPHALSRRLAPEVVAELVAEYQAGVSSLQLAHRYGIGKASVLALLDQQDVPRRHQPLTPEQLAEASKLYESGLSVAAVSAQMGVAARTVHRSLQRAGVAMRDTHGRPRAS